MKRLTFLFLLSLQYLNAGAQQQPQFTQYIFNNYLLNPAISGIENYIDVKAGYRKQWTGFDGAPETNYFSIHGPLGKSDLRSTATSFGGQENNPMSRSFAQSYTAAEPHHGIGLYGVFDKAGPFSQSAVNVTYAYHLGISATTNISMGISAGIRKLDITKANITLTDDSDPVLSRSDNNSLDPDLALGLWFYGPQYFVGISGQQLLTYRTEGSTIPLKNISILMFTAGYKLYAGENIGIIPSILVRKALSQPYSYDLNVKMTFGDKFWFGGGYRHKDAFSLLAGFYVSNLFNIGYSYDYTISQLSQTSRGSHEIVLGLLLNNIYKVTCPQKNW